MAKAAKKKEAKKKAAVKKPAPQKTGIDILQQEVGKAMNALETAMDFSRNDAEHEVLQSCFDSLDEIFNEMS